MSNPYLNSMNQQMQMMGYQNPYLPQPPIQKQQIVKVQGQEGANAYRMAEDSSALLLDESAPIVWLCRTDGAGYKTITPFTITPYEPEPPVDVKALENRISRIEEMIENVTKSNTSSNSNQPAKNTQQSKGNQASSQHN